MANPTLIELENGKFQRVPLPERHDPSPAERAAAALADQIVESALLKEMRWTAADLQTAFTFRLPVTTQRTTKKFNLLAGGTVGGELIFSRAAIAEWKTRLLQFAARVPR